MLVGYFCGMPYGESKKERKYKVTIDCPYSGELVLGADSPFTVNYNSDTNVFTPMRISTATINVLAGDYLLEIFSPCAQGTPITLSEILEDESEIVRWKGYLKPNLSNMGYNSCIEYVTLEASDCLASLQYLDFTPIKGLQVDEDNALINGCLKVASFDELLTKATELAGLSHYYFPNNKYGKNGMLTPFDLMISEKNFWTTDTDEPWKWDEVISEMCKYLGCTAIQWGNGLYIMDYGQYMTVDSQSLMMNGIFSHSNLISGVQQIDEKSYRGSGNNLSLDNVYNKIIVKDNFMTIDEFIPDLFEDSYLKNLEGDFWKAKEVYPSYGPEGYKRRLIKHGGGKGTEKVGDNKYKYYIKRYDHKYYHETYTNSSGGEVSIPKVECNPLDFNSNSLDRLSVDFINNDNVSHRIVAEYGIRYDWWPEDLPQGDYDTDNAIYTFTLDAHERKRVDWQFQLTPPEGERYNGSWWGSYTIDGGRWINFWETASSVPSGNIGATIVDFAYMEKDNSEGTYNYEVPNAISFNRYILIKQYDRPSGWYDPRMSGGLWNNLFPGNYDNYFPPVMSLENFSNPMIISKKAYLAIDLNAIHQRYALDYYNPEWTTKTSWDSAVLGWMNKTDTVGICAPAMMFKLRVGNKYWNGSSWTTSDSSFYVSLSTDTDKDGEINFKKMWNSEHHVLNNISWTDWTSGKGYKIPLDVDLDYNDIDFKILLPVKIQYIETKHSHDGINGCVWVKDFSVKLVTKDEDNYPLADVEYSNVLNDCSINEYPDISLKYTTYPGNGKQAYSNVGIRQNSGIPALLDEISDHNVTDTLRTPEENLLERYYNQYNSPTLTENLDVDLSFNPLHKIKDMYWEDDKYFIMTGGNIDYAGGKQNIQITQIKQV